MKKGKEKSTFGWVMTFAGQKKSRYIASVCLAVLGAAVQMLPYFVMGGRYRQTDGGESEFA